MSIKVKRIRKEDSLKCKCCDVRREAVDIKITGDYGFVNGLSLCNMCATALMLSLERKLEVE